MPSFAYIIVLVGWIVWLTPFLLARRKSSRPSKVDSRARWGILIQVVAYSILWPNRFWEAPAGNWKIGLSVLLLILAGLLSWSGTRALGRHWRIDAALDADHQLVRSGPYRLIRHPIYTSMLCILLGTGLIVTPLPILLLSTLLFVVGTEIRVGVEDALLAARFETQFSSYRSAVPAYIPFFR